MPEFPRIGIASGDPAGIGPEIVDRWMASDPEIEGSVHLFGPTIWTRRMGNDYGIRGTGLGPEGYRPVAGHPEQMGARIAWESLQAAAQACKAGDLDAVVTGPVSKAALAGVGFAYPGQTEFFAAAWGGEPVMAFTGGRLRVALATWHVPLSEVPTRLTPHRLERAVRAVDWLTRAEGIRSPRIGVCGLNPHAGEDGILGTEEKEWINPLLERLKADGLGVGPAQPADSLFSRSLDGEFDAVVALYHDQGLGPVKTIDFDQSVNVSLGLSHIRTSPDHGTAFSIAGKGIARWESLANAVKVAVRLANHAQVSGFVQDGE
jgi:4-hydroxythreonine-4-phosphate dehydrogenase